MDFKNFTTFTTAQLEQHFTTSITEGLSAQEARERQKQYGLNSIKTAVASWRTILLTQFKSPFVYLLFAAALVSIALQENINGIMIFSFILINAGLGFYQEFHAEQTLALLKKMIPFRERVLRDGKELFIATQELVPGDIVFFTPGDIIAADIRIVTEENLSIDESSISGETEPLHKTATPLTEQATTPFKALNIGFCGTRVVSGKGKGVVIATGTNTWFGSLSQLVKKEERSSIFAKEISKFSTFILHLMLLTITSIFLVHVFIKHTSIPITELALFAVALAVGIIPEALPVVVSFCLSRGARNLARNSVVARRLTAIEDLGSIEILCTDKTGTLTENVLTVAALYPQENPDLVFYGTLGSPLKQYSAQGLYNAFDKALYAQLTQDQKQHIGSYKKLNDIPFDPSRRSYIVALQHNQEYFALACGASETILGMCTLSAQQQESMIQWAKDQGKEGNRVIAVAKKIFSSPPSLLHDEDLREFTCIGLIAFKDPIKPSAINAITHAKQMGLQIKILTGDSPEVAGAVAAQIGLIKNIDEVITGYDLAHASTEKIKQSALAYHVFARVTPEQKYALIKALEQDNNVGFLGEGVNDVPALQAAHVAIVVDNATDVAKDAADIVLLKKSLHVIVQGIKEGRTILTNTLKYLKVTLSSNFSNFYTIAFVSLIIDTLPMLPLQILLVNLLSDFPLIAIATDKVDHDELTQPKTYHIRELLLMATFFGLCSSVFDLIFFSVFYDRAPEVLQTNWFVFSILTELFFFFSIRTKRFFLWGHRPSLTIITLAGISITLTIALPFTHTGRSLFSFITPSLHQMEWLVLIVISYFITIECIKLLYYRFSFSSKPTPSPLP